jgi:hypothetical protein
LQSGFTYNDSSDADFGVDPPSVFKTIVQGPLVKSSDPNDIGYNKMGPDLGEDLNSGYNNLGLSSFVINSEYSIDNDMPNNKKEARNYMLGLTRSGVYLNPCDENMFWSINGAVDCSRINPLFWLSGDPLKNYGWINNFPIDQRDLTSTGKFTLRKNVPMDIIVAYTVGRGTDHLNSITVARETVQYIHEEYARNFRTIVGVEKEEKELLPSSFTLYQNYPNPFNPTTSISYSIPTDEFVTLKVYDITGKEITILENERKQAGIHQVNFNAENLSSGIYIYSISAGKYSSSKKLLLVK